MANIRDIEGIADVTAEKLAGAGVISVESLLEKGGSKKGREGLAESTGIPEKNILRWVNHADLFRIHGVAGQFAELLEAAGVDSVAELAQRVPANLAAKLAATNEEKNLANRTPSETEVAKWVEEAKSLPKAVTH